MEQRTVQLCYLLLAVVRTYTEVDRMLTMLEALHPDVPEVKFVVEPGSEFARGLPGFIESLGFEVLTWKKARRRRFDIILAAHATTALGRLKGQVIVFPHGAGYNRCVPRSTGSHDVATGLVKRQLITWRGRIVPRVIFVSHAEQIERLRESAARAATRAVVLGDPVFDRIVASRYRKGHFREIFRVRPGQKLICVTSTWGRHGTVGRDASLAKRLLGQLPADEYRVLLILHPNIWSGHSHADIMAMLREERDSGLAVIPPGTPWEAGLIAADLVIGDHSSLSVYAAALGCRFLLAADGSAELVPSSPPARLCAEAPRLDPDGDLRRQIETHLASTPRLSAKAVADQVFQEQGNSWQVFRSVVRRYAELPELDEPPRTTPVDDPKPTFGRAVTSWLVSSAAEDTDEATPRVRISRFPRIVDPWEPCDPDAVQVADHAEVDAIRRGSSDILVHSEELSREEGEKWVLDHGGYATVVAYRHAGGCSVRWRSARGWDDSFGVDANTDDAFAAATVLYRLWLDGMLPARPGRVEYTLVPGQSCAFTFEPAASGPSQSAVVVQ